MPPWTPVILIRSTDCKTKLSNHTKAAGPNFGLFLGMGSWTSARSFHGCPRPNAYFSKVSRACPKLLTRDVRTNDPGTCAEYPAKKLSLWAVFRSSQAGGNFHFLFHFFPIFCFEAVHVSYWAPLGLIQCVQTVLVFWFGGFIQNSQIVSLI